MSGGGQCRERPREILIATRNPGKARELAALVARWAVRVRYLDEFPAVPAVAEKGSTYRENALAKAREAAAASGIAALADDSGLEVDALGGLPGLRSADYAPTDVERIARLLEALVNIPPQRRSATFRCAAALYHPDGWSALGEGSCTGWIAPAPAGRRGFGYDPIFFVPELGCTFAEASPAAKHRLSHRARAIRELERVLGWG